MPPTTTTITKPLALIVGLALAARNTDKFATLTAETSAKTFVCDATSTTDVQQLFASLQGESLQVVIYNPSRIVRGAIETVDVEQVRKAIDVTAFGSFIVAQQAAAAMLKAGQGGTILFTGASAGTKGFSKSAAFAMGKFAQRGLTESLSRKLHPQNIHVCWFNIDGDIANPSRSSPSTSDPDSMLDPAAIAQTYLAVVQQLRSAWSNEIALRPWVEKW